MGLGLGLDFGAMALAHEDACTGAGSSTTVSFSCSGAVSCLGWCLVPVFLLCDLGSLCSFGSFSLGSSLTSLVSLVAVLGLGLSFAKAAAHELPGGALAEVDDASLFTGVCDCWVEV